MARISTYKNDETVVAEDKWIGSDSQNNMQTKNFTAQSVADFINSIGGEAQNVRYRYNQFNDYQTGTIAFNGGGAASILLSSLTTFNIGIYETRSATTDVGEYLTGAFMASEVLLTQCDDISSWAIYTWDTAVLKASGLEYEVGLTFRAGGGTLIADSEYFISLMNYDSAAQGDLNKLVVLPGNALVYVVDHDLNKYPSVSVIETGTNNQIYGDVQYNTVNQCTLTFTSLVTGTATFN
tara:strand:+ start:2435 stop:3148 length:714 start_codon:yes stop_codon:yes gene_type:complete